MASMFRISSYTQYYIIIHIPKKLSPYHAMRCKHMVKQCFELKSIVYVACICRCPAFLEIPRQLFPQFPEMPGFSSIA